MDEQTMENLLFFFNMVAFQRLSSAIGDVAKQHLSSVFI